MTESKGLEEMSTQRGGGKESWLSDSMEVVRIKRTCWEWVEIKEGSLKRDSKME